MSSTQKESLHQLLVLQELVREFSQKCDAFDNVVCTGPIVDGSRIPSNDWERRFSTQYVHRMRQEIKRKAQELGYSTILINRMIAFEWRRKNGETP